MTGLMKLNRLALSLAFVLALITVGGCTIRLGDFTAISTKNVPVKYDTSMSVAGEDCAFSILGIPLGQPNLQEAVDNAVGSKGNALVNQVTYQSAWTAILFAQQCIEVKGEVVTLR